MRTDNPKAEPSERATVPDDDGGCDHASGDAEHDDEDQAKRRHDGDHDVIQGALVDVFVGG